MNGITIKDIARKCGVSVSTVSRAINNYPGINRATKDKIMQVIKENQFIPNNSARNLKRLESNAIVVLIKGINNPFFQPMISILENMINNRKYTFILQKVNNNEDEVERALEIVLEQKPKGIIFLGGYFNHTYEKLKQLDTPCIIGTVGDIDEKNGDICSSVHVDNIRESYKIVDYLCKSGHKRIAMFAAGMDDKSISYQRLEGYKQALKAHGLQIHPELIRYTKGNEDPYTMQRGYRDMKKLLEDNLDFTAIYAISDTVAIGICRALIEEGKKVPEDYSVVGFDGLDMGSYFIPTITTVKQPVEEMAKAIAEILFDTIENNSPPRHEIFDGELLIRESSAPVK